MEGKSGPTGTGMYRWSHTKGAIPMRFASLITVLASASLLGSAAVCPVMAQGDAHHAKSHSDMSMASSRYGGPAYTGKPALTVTASLVEAGGGPENYSTAKALTSMVGEKAVNDEVTKL